MKKSALIITATLVSLGLTSWGIFAQNDWQAENLSTCETAELREIPLEKDTTNYSDFLYSWGPRFQPIRKGDFKNANSITDFLQGEEIDNLKNYKSVSIILIEDGDQSVIQESGTSDVLTDKQKALLNSLPYSSSFLVRADYSEKSTHTDKWEHDYFSPYFTIVPEKQAEYVSGKPQSNIMKKESGREALVLFLAYGNKENIINLDEDKLKPAKLNFTVTSFGTVQNIRLESSSGFPNIDKHMIKLMSQTPGYWVPAENAIGEKVDQDFVVSFGLLGC